MGVAVKNSSMIGLKSTEGAKSDKSKNGFAAEIAKRALSDKKKSSEVTSYGKKKTCICAPTTHPGSFRCKLHRATRSSSSNPIIIKTSRTPCLSRFARDVSQKESAHESLLSPQYHSE